MQYYDVYDWPKKFLEDSLMSENNELENIFVDDYIKKIMHTKIEDFDENKLEELLSIVSRLASFFSRLRVTLDEALGEVILNRLMEEADREAEGHLDISDSHPFKRIDKDDLPESIKNLFEEEE
tara:strand:+ start:168 stop:539 length:372 start_codon:yes stop_codon:yes gene_type:complete